MHLILTQPNTTLDIIRTHFAKARGHLFVLVPEITTAAYFRKVLKGLDPQKVTIGTRKDLFRPWHHLTDIIVEDPLHEAYKSTRTPQYNAPDVARELARIHNASLTYLTPALSAANQYLIEKKVFSFANKKPHWPQITLVDMEQERNSGNTSILSRAAQDVITSGQGSVLWYSPRKAYSSLVRCQACRTSITCARCRIPLRLHRYGGDDGLVCYHCAVYLPIPKACPSCNGGPLKPAGIPGSQKIVSAIGTDVPILDSDLVKTAADEREILRRHEAMDRPMLVATQMIFSHRYERQFDHIVVVGTDALSYNPDFRTQERLVYQFEKLADFKPKTMLLQYWDSRGAVARAPERDWASLFDDELTDRKALGWPPYARIIKLSIKHADRSTSARQAAIATDRLRRAADYIKGVKAMSILGPTPALVERTGGKWTQHLILKTTLAPEKLRALLAHVPLGISIDVDPRSIS